MGFEARRPLGAARAPIQASSARHMSDDRRGGGIDGIDGIDGIGAVSSDLGMADLSRSSRAPRGAGCFEDTPSQEVEERFAAIGLAAP
jgi:hypothetical protein